MDNELWRVLYHHVREVSRGFRQKYVHIPGWILILTMLWAALHERPISWACQAKNWRTTRLRPPRLPSDRTMSRRVDGVAVGWLWCAIERRLRESSGEHPGLIAFLDGKPLPIGGASKDPDAGYGRAAGVMAKGYKLHAVWSNRAMPETWEVTPMNTGEKTVAHRLIPQLHSGGYLLADGNYDSSKLFDAAWRQQYQLVTPLPRGQAGAGHHYQSVHRHHSIALMQRRCGERLYAFRATIDRLYGNATSFGGGLSPLPAWVRGLARVRTWVWAKLFINAARIINLNELRQV